MRCVLLAVLTALLAGPAGAQSTFLLNDTLFIQRDTLDGAYHAVFLLAPGKHDHRTASCAAWSAADSSYRAEVSEACGPADVGAALAAFDGCWLPLFAFQGELCLYDPCDGLFEHSLWKDGGRMVEGYGDGPLVALLHAMPVEETGVWQAKRCFGDILAGDTLRVRWLDRGRGIAGWTTGRGTALYVRRDKAGRLPMVVNHSPEHKWVECCVEQATPAMVRP